MALRDSLDDLASHLEEEYQELVNEGEHEVGIYRIRYIAREIRNLVKASEQTVPTKEVHHPRNPPPYRLDTRLDLEFQGVLPDVLPAYEGKQVKEQAAKLKKEEANAERMVEAIDGPADGCMVGVPGDMPVNAKTLVAGNVYILSPGNVLRFSEEDTRRFYESQTRK